MKKCLSALYSAIFLLFPLVIYSQQWDLRGQLTSSTILHNAPIAGNIEIDQRVRYIPTLSIYPKYKFLSNFDFETAFNLQANFDRVFGSEEGNNYDGHEIHRLWARYSTDNIEIRYGIQKISFGPGSILRPLRWFDTLDEKDPTGQSEGVTALRLKYFGGRSITYWGWIIHPENSEISSRGGRIEIPIAVIGDIGVTYHHRPPYMNGRVPDRSGISLGWANSGEDRYALDIRTDLVVGLWAEGVVSNSFDNTWTKTSSRIYMIGGDYTFPIGSGLYFLTEHSLFEFELNLFQKRFERKDSVVMLTYPLGMLDQLSFISEYFWDNELSYNFFRYSRTYDNYSFNILLTANQTINYISIHDRTYKSSSNFQKTVEFLIIYNH